MKYFTQIEAFFNKEMTTSEREAFEHEVMDNADLAREFEAYQTGVELFGFTASILSDEQITSSKKQNFESESKGGKENVSNLRLHIILAFILMGILVALMFNKREAVLVEPKKEKEQPGKHIPIAEAPLPVITSFEQRQFLAMLEFKMPNTQIVFPLRTPEPQEPLSNSEPKFSKTIESPKNETKISNKKPSSIEMTSNALIASGERIIYKAGQRITLTPGFHAKAGSTFKAVVNNN